LGFIITDVVAVAEHPNKLVTVTVYTPAAAVVTLLMLGFCKVEVNPFGPVQEKDAADELVHTGIEAVTA